MLVDGGINLENNVNSCNKEQKCLAYAFVNNQTFTNIYPVNEALCNGTLFKDLNLPINIYGK